MWWEQIVRIYDHFRTPRSATTLDLVGQFVLSTMNDVRNKNKDPNKNNRRQWFFYARRASFTLHVKRLTYTSTVSTWAKMGDHFGKRPITFLQPFWGLKTPPTPAVWRERTNILFSQSYIRQLLFTWQDVHTSVTRVIQHVSNNSFQFS